MCDFHVDMYIDENYECVVFCGCAVKILKVQGIKHKLIEDQIYYA